MFKIETVSLSWPHCTVELIAVPLSKAHPGPFWLEKIGDCYVAVTGLPKEQPRHALIMVRFARDCLIKMNKLTRQLQGILGDDTANLAMRVGIHRYVQKFLVRLNRGWFLPFS